MMLVKYFPSTIKLNKSSSTSMLLSKLTTRIARISLRERGMQPNVQESKL